MAKLLLLFTLLLPPAAPAAPPAAIRGERITLRYQKELSKKEPTLRPAQLTPYRQRLALDAAEALLAAGLSLPFDKLVPEKQLSSLAPRQRARWHRLRFPSGAPEAAEDSLLQDLAAADLSAGLLYELYKLRPKFSGPGLATMIAAAEESLPQAAATWKAAAPTRAFTPPSAEEVKALFTELPALAEFQNGAFAGKARLFMFCRHDRKQKCLLALRDKDNQAVRLPGGALWTQPSLGLSSRGLPYNERMGYTPQGVHLIRGVMPEANFPEAYGRHRRLILEFVAKSANEAEQRKLLPKSAQAKDWWKEAVVARDIGRDELRIHGTGDRNDDATSAYYPFVPTIGCVAQRELSYGGVNYNDQRLLLDTLMRAGGLGVGYASEPLIQGLLYVIELSAGGGAVTAAELARFGVQ